MDADQLAAVVGVSAGVGWFVGWTMALAWRKRTPTRTEKRVRWVYRHLDEVLGATKHENQLRADKRFALIHPRLHLRRPWKNWRLLIQPRKFRETIANWLWPIPRIGPGVNPIPSDQRIAEYVWTYPDRPRTWTVRYSPEAAANWPQFVEWLTRGRPNQGGGLAMALGLEWRPDLFEVERDFAKRLVHLTLAGPPEELPARPPMDVRSAT